MIGALLTIWPASSHFLSDRSTLTQLLTLKKLTLCSRCAQSSHVSADRRMGVSCGMGIAQCVYVEQVELPCWWPSYITAATCGVENVQGSVREIVYINCAYDAEHQV